MTMIHIGMSSGVCATCQHFEALPHLIMDSSSHPFLFSFLEDKPRLTSRRVHLRRLYDVLHFSLQRHDMMRARRAWAILARCNEVNWKTLWTLSIGLLNHRADTTGSSPVKIDYLRSMMLQHPEEVRPSQHPLLFSVFTINSAKRSSVSLSTSSSWQIGIGMPWMNWSCAWLMAPSPRAHHCSWQLSSIFPLSRQPSPPSLCWPLLYVQCPVIQ